MKKKQATVHDQLLQGMIDVAEAQSKICVKMLNDAINVKEAGKDGITMRGYGLRALAIEALAKLEGMVIMLDVFCNDQTLVQHYYDGIEAGRKALKG